MISNITVGDEDARSRDVPGRVYEYFLSQFANAEGKKGSEKDTGEYADVPGVCKSASVDEIRKHGHVLTPGRYVGAEPQADDGEPFEDKMKRLVKQLQAQQTEGARLDADIKENLEGLGSWKDER